MAGLVEWRSLASGIDKSWRAKGVDADAVIREVEPYDVHAAASLKLMHAFPLRFKESVMFRPYSDLVSPLPSALASGVPAQIQCLIRRSDRTRLRVASGMSQDLAKPYTRTMSYCSCP